MDENAITAAAATTREPSRSRLVWFAVAVVAVLVAAVVTTWREHEAAHYEPSPPAEHYRSVGSYLGVDFWLKWQGDHRVAIRTTGHLGGVCNGSGGAGYSKILLCADTVPGGSVVAGLVPATASAATVRGTELHLLPLARRSVQLAVLVVVGDGDPMPLGPLVAECGPAHRRC